MKKTLFCIAAIVFSVQAAFSHCQVPCGIYGDEILFSKMNEDIATIEKAMNEISRLSKEGDKNYNQIVRWVNTKEDHADRIMKSASDYFLAQRVHLPKKGSEDKVYVQKLSLLHSIIVYAMKTKQTTDLSNVEKLKSFVEEFEAVYLEKK